MTEKTSAPKGSAINIVFIFFITVAVLFAAFSGKMAEITDASFSAAKDAVTLAIGLIGIMALWLGLVRVLEAGGLMLSLARALKPLMKRLFPDVPDEHPAMSAMILNVSANMLGLGNAATPFGIKAMMELDRLNPFKGTATNAMCLFLAINTSSVALLPLGVIGVRAAAGASLPAAIFLPTLLATLSSTIIGVSIAILLARRDLSYAESFNIAQKDLIKDNKKNSKDDDKDSNDFSHLLIEPGRFYRISAILLLIALIAAFIYNSLNASSLSHFLKDELATFWLMPVLMFLILIYGLYRGVKVYEAVTEGAKQGFDIALRIIPFLVAILVAIAMFRASGAMEALASVLDPFTSLINMPAEVLPMALIRPLSGSGAFGIMSSLIESAPDSYPAFLASTMMGSTETTFYVLAVYFGAAGIVKIRHALLAALCADVGGIIAASLLAPLFY